jgi:hypothetical protein
MQPLFKLSIEAELNERTMWASSLSKFLIFTIFIFYLSCIKVGVCARAGFESQGNANTSCREGSPLQTASERMF